MARFEIPVDMKTVMAAVGSTMAAEGLRYYRDRAVHVASVEEVDGGLVITAGVRGTAREPYRVRIAVRLPDGTISSSCTCPVAGGCQHVAATLFALRPADRPRELPVGLADEHRHPPALWERMLTARATAHRSADPEPIALLIERRATSHGHQQLAMRPAIMGKKGRWVRTGISWSDLRYPVRRFPPEAAALLTEIATLSEAARSRYYYTEPTVIDLATFPSRRIWAILAEAETAGLTLIGNADGAPVVVRPEPVCARLDVTAGPRDSWLFSPQLRVGGVDGNPVPGPITLLGEPAHGIAFIAPGGSEIYDGRATGTAPAPGPAVLHLARLAEPLDEELAHLFALGDPIPVPPADQPRFIRDHLPDLRRRVTVRGTSVALPDRARVELHLAVDRDDIGMVTAAWHWRYLWGSEAIDIPYGLPNPSALRDLDVERKLAAEALAAVQPATALHRYRAFGDELAPAAVLSRGQALRLARDVLPALDTVLGIVVTVAAGALDFRQADTAPVVAMAGSLTPDKDWLDLAVTITVDGEDVPFAELFTALAKNEPVMILPSGTYFPLDTPELKQLQTVIAESFHLTDRDALAPDQLRLHRYDSDLWDELAVMGVLDEQALAWSATIRELARVTEIGINDVPAQLTARLRPYQEIGYSWLAFLYEHGLGGVLADDMGLGKTIQILAMITRARAADTGGPPFLVVAPTSVVGNWIDEARRFTPHLRAVAVAATAGRRGATLAELAADADIVVTSYALFRLEYDAYAECGFAALILDEAQQIKNHRSQGYQCARRLPVPVKFAVTGTPLENNLMELWALYSITAPGLLGDPKRFTEHYRNPIERAQDTERLATLRRRIRPLLLRRTKGEVVTDLPPKSEQVISLDLVAGHRRAYQRYLQRERRKVLGLIGDMDRNRFQIFRSLTTLRQAALDVTLLDEDDTAPSTKLDALVELVAAAAEEGHRVLVFSQFTRFLRRARDRLTAAGVDSCYLDGATRRRAAVIDEFRTGTAPVFLISLKAGGVGLNLTEADYCIITDPWWNPATEAQAVDRAHRIGQDRPVMVYRLIAADTIEEKVMALKSRKAALFSSVMEAGGVGGSGLTADDIRSLIT